MRKKLKKFLLNDLFLLLPQDVLIDQILLKLPLKSLMKLRCVSKYFKNLITSPSFVYQHLHHSTSQLNNHLVLISSLYPTLYHDNRYLYAQFEVNNYACNFSDDPSRPDVVDMPCPFESATLRGYDGNGNCLYHYEPAYIQASCNGLLYLHTKDMNYIWNPCTKEYKEVPPPPYGDELLFSGFGYDRVNDQYKILYHGRYNITEVKVYTLGTNNTWRSIGCDNYKPYRSLCFGRWKRIGLFVNGALHWIMTSTELKSCIDAKAHIISLDIENEEFGEVQKPQSILEEDEYYWDLQVLQGYLCICQVLSGGIDIWILKDYDVKDSWTKLFTVVEPQMYSEKHFKLLRFCENGEIVMVRDRDSLVVYDAINRQTRGVEKLEGLRNITAFYMIYTESLVSVNSGTYRG